MLNIQLVLFLVFAHSSRCWGFGLSYKQGDGIEYAGGAAAVAADLGLGKVYDVCCVGFIQCARKTFRTWYLIQCTAIIVIHK